MAGCLRGNGSNRGPLRYVASLRIGSGRALSLCVDRRYSAHRLLSGLLSGIYTYVNASM